MDMDEREEQLPQLPRTILWEAPEHSHVEKSQDWFWVLGILATALVVVAILLQNLLLALLITIGAVCIGALANRTPKIIPYEVNARGIRVGDQLYPYATLDSFYIDEENPLGPQLLLKSDKLFMPLIILPLPPEYLDDIDDTLGARLPEEHLEEPLVTKLLEFFGF